MYRSIEIIRKFPENFLNRKSRRDTVLKIYPNVERDLLILVASFRRSPSAPELFCLPYTQKQQANNENFPTYGYSERSIEIERHTSMKINFHLFQKVQETKWKLAYYMHIFAQILPSFYIVSVAFTIHS